MKRCSRHLKRNIGQNHNKLSPHTFKNSYHQDDKVWYVWARMKRKVNLLYNLFVGMQVDSTTMEIQMEFHKK